MPLDTLFVFILSCVCINALTSYPVQILAAFNIIENFEIFKSEAADQSSARFFIKKLLLRSSVIGFTTLISFSVTTFTDFINIGGAIGSVPVAFILPELLYWKVFGAQMTTWQKAGCVFITVFGICGSSYSVFYSLQKRANNDLS